VHQQRLAGAGGVLQANLVQLIERERRDAGLIAFAFPIGVERLYIGIEIAAQGVDVGEIAVEIDLREQ
jgi:hypothetical protein